MRMVLSPYALPCYVVRASLLERDFVGGLATNSLLNGLREGFV
jgi:hypothetical protein